MASTPSLRSDADCIDFLFFTAGRHEGDAAAARQYLTWEIGLVDQLDAQERGSFWVCGRARPLAPGFKFRSTVAVARALGSDPGLLPTPTHPRA